MEDKRGRRAEALKLTEQFVERLVAIEAQHREHSKLATGCKRVTCAHLDYHHCKGLGRLFNHDEVIAFKHEV